MKKFIKNYGSYILIILIVMLIRTFVFTFIKVNGSSMDKTLKDGEIMILLKSKNISREDIVVVSKNVSGSAIIKRVIGMPGDVICCEDGQIYINGKKYDDKYAFGDTSDFDKITLGEDEYFVLGDNREYSYDSRSFGNVNVKDILGKTNFVLFPLSKMGKVN